MTDWVASRSFFCLKTARKMPEIEQNCPNTALMLYKALFAQIERRLHTLLH